MPFFSVFIDISYILRRVKTKSNSLFSDIYFTILLLPLDKKFKFV